MAILTLKDIQNSSQQPATTATTGGKILSLDEVKKLTPKETKKLGLVSSFIKAPFTKDQATIDRATEGLSGLHKIFTAPLQGYSDTLVGSLMAPKNIEKVAESEAKYSETLLNLYKQAREKGDRQSMAHYERMINDESKRVAGRTGEDILKEVAPEAAKTNLQAVGQSIQAGIGLYSLGALGAGLAGVKEPFGAITSKAPVLGKQVGLQLPSFAELGTRTALPRIAERAALGFQTLAPYGALYAGGLEAGQEAPEGETAGEAFGRVGGAAVKGGLTTGAIGAVGFGLLPEVGRGLTKIKEHIVRGRPSGASFTEEQLNAETAKYKIQNGRVIKDPVADEALKNGLDEKQVDFIKKTNNPTYSEIQKAAEAKSKDISLRATQHDVVGREVNKAIKFLDDQVDDLGRQLGTQAKAMPKVPVDISTSADDFQNMLTQNGVNIADDGTLDFSQSIWRNQKSAQTVANRVWDLLPDENVLTPEQIARTRQTLFVDWQKAITDKSLTGKDPMTSALQKLYSTIDDGIANPNITGGADYLATKMKYAQARTAYDTAIRSMYGSKFGRFTPSELMDKRAGEFMRRSLGNASAEPLRVVDMLEKTAKELGYKGNLNLYNQAQFANMMEDFYNIQQPTGFAGSTAKGIKAFELATSPRQAIKTGLEYVSKVTPETRNQALIKLLNSNGYGDLGSIKITTSTPTSGAKGIIDRAKDNIVESIKNPSLGLATKDVSAQAQAPVIASTKRQIATQLEFLLKNKRISAPVAKQIETILKQSFETVDDLERAITPALSKANSGVQNTISGHIINAKQELGSITGGEGLNPPGDPKVYRPAYQGSTQPPGALGTALRSESGLYGPSTYTTTDKSYANEYATSFSPNRPPGTVASTIIDTGGLFNATNPEHLARLNQATQALKLSPAQLKELQTLLSSFTTSTGALQNSTIETGQNMLLDRVLRTAGFSGVNLSEFGSPVQKLFSKDIPIK